MATSADDLLEVAEFLVANAGRVTAARLRRATSTAYYALFHCLAKDCADLLIGRPKAASVRSAWRLVYRALDHGETKTRCQNRLLLNNFPAAIQEFARAFVTLQSKRHEADYDPDATFTRANVQLSIAAARVAITDFRTVPIPDRRAFCAYLLFRDRRS